MEKIENYYINKIICICQLKYNSLMFQVSTINCSFKYNKITKIVGLEIVISMYRVW